MAYYTQLKRKHRILTIASYSAAVLLWLLCVVALISQSPLLTVALALASVVLWTIGDHHGKRSFYYGLRANISEKFPIKHKA